MDARRIIIAGERRAELEAFELDTRGLGASEVVVRTLVTLISPGTEGAAFLGLKAPGRATEGGYPQRVGYASVGEVLETGAEASVTVGQRVYSMSGHTSAVRLDTRETLCLAVPDGVPPEEAVFARMATVSMASLRTAAARSGDRAAVVGLGLVGNLAGQLCETAGMPATGVDLLAGRCELARRCGLTSVLEAPSPEELRAEHALVLECTGTPRGALTALALAGRGGELALVGAPWGRGGAEVTAHAVLERIFAGYVRMRSGWEWQLPVFPSDVAAGSHAENSRRALELIRQGRLRVREMLTHRLPPAAAQEAYAGAVDKKDEYMGVVFSWEGA